MKRLFILACVLLLQVANTLSAQCNRPAPSDNPCNAPTFCNTAQLDAFCSAVPTPNTTKVFIKPNGFCGSLESPSWFKFVAETPTLQLRFAATACTGNGVQALILSTTNCSDSAAYTPVADCLVAVNKPVDTLRATGLVAGQTYYLLVDGFGGNQCPYTIDVIGGTTIQATSTTLTPPSVIFGPTSVCAGATDIVFSVPKAAGITNYRFIVTDAATNAVLFDGTAARTDSFYSVPAFPAIAAARVCVSYVNDCGVSVATCSTVTIGGTLEIISPTVYLCFGNTYDYPGGQTITNNNLSSSDLDQDISYNKPGQNGACDTVFKVKIISYAYPEATRVLLLKPAESIAVCNTTITGNVACLQTSRTVTCAGAAANGCDSTVNLVVLNAKQTSIISPTNPALNCNSASLTVAHSDICTGTTRHTNTYQWFYQAVANGPLSNLNNRTATQLAATAGTYFLVVRDSVASIAAGFPGFRIIIDTIRSTVTGNGSTGALTTPSLINGRTDTTVCQGATATFKINKVLNATSYTWRFGRNGGTIIGAATDTSVVVQWAGNTSGDTLFVSARDACGASPEQKIAVLVRNFANLDAGPNRIVCTLQTALAGASSGAGTGKWTTISATGAIFADDTSPTTDVTAPNAGVYQFVWTETLNTCSKSDTVDITFGTPPQYTSFKDSCNVARTNFFVKFNVLGGTAPFTVINAANMASVGAVSAARAFVSNPLPVGVYNLQIKDANNCLSTPIPAAQTCTACFTKSGAIDTTTALSICEGDLARATYNAGYISDGNDTLQFVLHTGNPRTGIVQRSYGTVFGFTAGMTYETRYFISAIAGDDSSRQVKLLDACFSASAGVAVVFHKKPTATFAADATSLCVGDCTNLRYTFTGNKPFMVTTRITEIIGRDTTVSDKPAAYVLPICPTVNTTYRLVSVSDSFGCSTIGLTQQIIVRTTVPVEAGTPRPPLSICSGIDTSVNLLTQLINTLQGGTWTETSVVRSTGTAFSAAGGSFRSRGQIAGTYRFSYVVRQVVGSPCPADTANVTLILLPAPIANAGPNDTINCIKTSIDLGGANTSFGTGISYKWTGGNAGGNASRISVSEPGTYILTVNSPTCASRDTVVIFIDTTSPRAIISPIAVNTLTCRLDTIRLNGATSTPIGRIAYEWSRGNDIVDDNPITQVTKGDLYRLKVTNRINGCSATDTARVNENRQLPKILIKKPSTVNCKDSIVTIDASNSSSGAAFTFRWKGQFGGKFFSDSTTLQPKSKSAGQYQLVITNTLNNCVDSDFVFINVDTLRPQAIARALDTLDCSNPTVNLNGRGSTLITLSGVVMTFSWVARPGNLTSGETTLNATADEPGVYILTVQNPKNFCTDSDTALVVRNTGRPNNVNITIKQPSCYGECDANFKIDTVIGGTKPYLYSTDGKVFTTRNLFQNQCAGTYKLYVQDAGGCQIDTTFSINQDRQLSVSLGADTLLKLGDSLLLRVQSNVDSIKNIVWTPVADTSKCPKGGFCTQQIVRPIVSTVYKAAVTNKAGCVATGTIRVSIDKKRPIFVPNIFSPTSGGPNAVLMIYGSNVVKIIKRFQIYDRWGGGVFMQQNFQTDNPAFGWDGRLRGTEALPDVYVYFIEVEYLDKTTEILQGDFTLIR